MNIVLAASYHNINGNFLNFNLRINVYSFLYLQKKTLVYILSKAIYIILKGAIGIQIDIYIKDLVHIIYQLQKCTDG